MKNKKTKALLQEKARRRLVKRLIKQLMQFVEEEVEEELVGSASFPAFLLLLLPSVLCVCLAHRLRYCHSPVHAVSPLHPLFSLSFHFLDLSRLTLFLHKHTRSLSLLHELHTRSLNPKLGAGQEEGTE